MYRNHPDFSVLWEDRSTVGLRSHRTLFSCSGLQPHLIPSIFSALPSPPALPAVTRAQGQQAVLLIVQLVLWVFLYQCQQRPNSPYPQDSSRSRGERRLRRPRRRSQGPPPARSGTRQPPSVFPTGAPRDTAQPVCQRAK